MADTWVTQNPGKEGFRHTLTATSELVFS